MDREGGRRSARLIRQAQLARARRLPTSGAGHKLEGLVEPLLVQCSDLLRQLVVEVADHEAWALPRSSADPVINLLKVNCASFRGGARTVLADDGGLVDVFVVTQRVVVETSECTALVVVPVLKACLVEQKFARDGAFRIAGQVAAALYAQPFGQDGVHNVSLRVVEEGLVGQRRALPCRSVGQIVRHGGDRHRTRLRLYCFLNVIRNYLRLNLNLCLNIAGPY